MVCLTKREEQMKNVNPVLIAVSSVLIAVFATGSVGAQNKPWNQPKTQQQPANLPETTKLEQNDNLDPTVNRTQAMRTEAESGSIAPITGQPLIQNKNKQQPKATKSVGKRPVVRVY